MGNESDVIVETKNLTKTYRDFWGRQKVRALKALDLEIRRGEIFGLLGPNGSGKTTTIKLLLGLLFPTSGEVNILGRPASDVAKNERIGYLPEESYLYRFLNAEETLDFYGRLFKIPSAIRRQKVAQLIQMVGLDTANKRQLREYSKGMTRRLGLAQALINDPDLIVLDEPTSGLDPVVRDEVVDMFYDFTRDENHSILISSHIVSDLEKLCDYVAFLHKGKILLCEEKDVLLSEYGIIHCTVEQLSELDDEVIKYRKETPYGVEILVPRKDAPKDFKISPISIEELFVFMVKETK